jgi:hypothetical protein
MNRYITAGIVAVCASLSLLLCVLAFEIVHTGFEIRHDADTITAHTVQQVDGLDLKRLSQDTGKLIVKANDTLVLSQLAAKQELKTLNTLQGSFEGTLTGVNALVAHLDTSQAAVTGAATATLNATTDTVKAVQPVLAEGTKSVATANATITDLDKLITGPVLTQTIDNVQVVTKNFGDITGTANAVTKKAAAPYLAPPSQNPLKRFWNAAQPWLLAGVKVLAAA